MFKKGVALCFAIFLLCLIPLFPPLLKGDIGRFSRVVSERLIAQIDLSSWIQESFKVSPDSKRAAYVAKVGDKQFVVVDGKEEMHCDAIGAGALIFSPDSKRVAYGAVGGNKQFVVVDGKEGKQYDGIATLGGGRIVFNSPDSFYYLTIKEGGDLYLVEERIE